MLWRTEALVPEPPSALHGGFGLLEPVTMCDQILDSPGGAIGSGLAPARAGWQCSLVLQGLWRLEISRLLGGLRRAWTVGVDSEISTGESGPVCRFASGRARGR